MRPPFPQGSCRQECGQERKRHKPVLSLSKGWRSYKDKKKKQQRLWMPDRVGHDKEGRAGAKPRMTPSLELPHPAHFNEVAFEVPQLRVGFADLVGKRDLGAEPEHRDRAVEQRGRQDAGLVFAVASCYRSRTGTTRLCNPSTGTRR